MVALQAIHHIGATVSDVDRALEFWRPFLGVEPRWRRLLDGPYLGGVTGYPGIHIEAAMIELPGGTLLELLDYQTEDKRPSSPRTGDPGNVHVCLQVDDVEREWRRAVELGAEAVTAGPAEITVGPNAGAKATYLRTPPDGITLELFQTP